MKRNNMVNLILPTALNRSIKSIFILAIILLIRKMLNIKSIRWANIILWMIFFAYLLFPRSILITVTDFEKFGWLQDILRSMSVISGHIKKIEKEAGYILSPINQMFVTGLVLIYVAVQIIKRNRTMRDSVMIERGSKADEYLSLFNLRRKVDIFINDKIASPVTYGIIHPKIVLQSYIFEDDELLKYVLIHELTHIKKFDIAFSHLKNLIMCINWYNPFILGAAKYIEDDIEILCDKLVIKRAGDTREHRKEYCMAMLKLTERNENSRFVLKLHPTKERIIVMKKWRRTVLGIVAFTVAVGASMTSFVEVRAIETNQVVANVESSYTPINEDNKVEEIIEKEYIELVENQAEIVPYIADINGNPINIIAQIAVLEFPNHTCCSPENPITPSISFNSPILGSYIFCQVIAITTPGTTTGRTNKNLYIYFFLPPFMTYTSQAVISGIVSVFIIPVIIIKPKLNMPVRK